MHVVAVYVLGNARFEMGNLGVVVVVGLSYEFGRFFCEWGFVRSRLRCSVNEGKRDKKKLLYFLPFFFFFLAE